MKEIRELWWKNRNSAEAASKFYDDKFIEKKLLDGLAQFGENDYANALRRVRISFRNNLFLFTMKFTIDTSKYAVAVHARLSKSGMESNSVSPSEGIRTETDPR